MRTLLLLVAVHGFMFMLLIGSMGTKDSRKGLNEAAHLMTKNIP